MIKPLLAGLAGLTVLTLEAAGSARAADVLVGAAPVAGPPPVVYNWTGFYLGGNVGGHFGNDDISTTTGVAAIDTISSTALKPQGVLAGLQAGYNWQIGNVLVGIELDGNWMDGTASRTLTNFGPPLNRGDVLATDVNPVFLTTVRPRLGVVFDRFLVYVTGGLAVSTFKTTDSFTQGGTVFATSKSTTRTGETIGGGLEYAFLDSWTFKAEYLYTSFGSYDTDIQNNTVVHHKYSDNIARIGLNYRFFGPVYWKY